MSMRVALSCFHAKTMRVENIDLTEKAKQRKARIRKA